MDEILASRHRPRRYPWTPNVLWEGGTLLMTRQSGQWQPVWYKAGIITRHCRRVSLATGRQILFCEETDSGMGRTLHGLYTIDFTAPKFAWDSVVLMADSYGDPDLGGVQRQAIDRVSLDERGNGDILVRVYAQHGRITLGPDDASEQLPTPKLSNYEIDLRLEGKTFKITPQTAAAARLFGVR